MNRRALSLIIALALAGITRPAFAAQTIHDQKLGFSFTLPDDFQSTAAATPGSPLSFIRGQPSDASFAVLQIVPMRGTIGPGKLQRDLVEKAARDSSQATGATITRFDYRQARWNTFDLEVVASFISSGQKNLVSLTTQVPLASQALQVILIGPAQDEARLVGEWNAVLASLTGKSNWRTDAEKSEQLGRLVGMVLVPVLAGLVFFVLRRRRQQKT